MTKMLKVIHRLLLIKAPRPALQIIDIVVREPVPTIRVQLKMEETKCQRCDRVGHIPAYCTAKYDIAGYEIDEDVSV